ncbi:MAG TPA: DUF433 domain-containing protein [Chloroflexia bacterium]|nr:DUF433 domain-containing protein [Chloroflexia bacterium]
MQLEDYFDFLRPDDIRVKGTRVGIETILYDFIYKSRRPEEIVQSYPTLTLEQVYATITYYLHKNEEVKEYIANWIAHGERMREEQNLNPTPAMLRLRAIAAEWRAREKEEQEKEAQGKSTVSK